MIQYNTLNVKSSNSQLNKLIPTIKIGTEVTLNSSSNVVGDSNDENNFPHKLLLTNTQVPRLHKAFANNSSANVKLLKKKKNQKKLNYIKLHNQENFWENFWDHY